MEAKSCPEPFLLDCLYCHSLDGRSVLRDPLVVRCLNCGLYRPRERLNQVAQLEYISSIEQDLNIENYLKPLERAKFLQSEVDGLRPYCPDIFHKGRVLDVGAGEGTFVAAMQSAGARATGLEPIGKLVSLARESGLDVRKGRFNLGGLDELGDECFDLISAREVIYYFSDLREFFILARKMLNPEGWLYIKAHQAESCWYWLYPGRVRRYGRYVQGMPTPPALRSILRQEKFEIHYFGFCHMWVLRQLGVTSRGFLRWDPVISACAKPLLALLGAGDRIMLLAQRMGE